jgi:predicted TIM-barrel fold metal-dependent hydrolase
MPSIVDIAPLVSADAHVEEPHDLWYDALPASMRDQAPRQIRPKGEGGWELVINGEPLGWGAREDERVQALDPAARLAAMDTDGIAGECIFPTIGLYVWNVSDPEVGRACCEVYNDWILDTLETASPRFRCAGIVPTWSVADAVAEVERIASRGLAAAMLPLVGTPEYNHRSWAPLWEAIDGLGLPVVMHQGTGHDMVFYRGPGASVANLLATQSMAPRSVGLFATSGVLARHPDLRLVYVECNAGWLAWAMDTLDTYDDAFRRYGWVDPRLDEPPSAYVARQVHATFQDDPTAIRNIERTGVDALLWGSDYPHEEGTYPRSREVVDRLVRNLDVDTATRVIGATTAALFSFDPSVTAASGPTAS